MAGNLHFNELLQELNDAGVEYLVIGGYAVMFYTEPRFTKDLDIWVRNTTQNSQAVYDALVRYGAPLKSDGITPESFTQSDLVYQIGVVPMRVDFSTYIDGLGFDTAWQHKVPAQLFGASVNVISLPDLILNKKAADRPDDRKDVKRLEKKAEPPKARLLRPRPKTHPGD
jgi:predicted nucleotidyltransferase